MLSTAHDTAHDTAHAPHGIALSPCRRFRCRTFEELVRWSNALSLSFSPPPVTEAQLGLGKAKAG